ncbi:MAG: DNA translocase FtsK [Bacteroidia bacterium]|nr:DNA translocase FtsK [Bacteroidia bacterium]
MAKNAPSRKKKAPAKAASPGPLSLLIRWTGSLRYDPASQDQARKLLGWFLVFASVISLIACISYYFTGNADQSLAEAGTEAEAQVQNWLGFAGAWIAELLVRRGFGIFSFLILLYALFGGLVLLENDYYQHLVRVLKYVAFTVFFGSFFFAYIEILSGSVRFDLGGGFGVTLNFWLFRYLGKIGVAFLILFLLVVFLVINFNAELRASQLLSTLRHARMSPAELTRKASELLARRQEPPASKNRPAKFRPQPPAQPQAGQPEPPVQPRDPAPRPRPVPQAAPPLPQPESGQQLNLDITLKPERPPDRVPPPADGPDLELIIETSEPDRPVPPARLEQVGDDNIGKVLGAGDDKYQKIVPEEDLEVEDADEILETDVYDPTQELSEYERPPFELLEDHGGGRGREVNREELETNKNKILRTLEDYGIKIVSIKATIGPTVTLYEIVPAPGIRISKIKNLEDDIALSLAALGIRIIAPIPGKGTIGIEVPNSNPEIVSLRSVLTTEKFISSKSELPVALGRTISNEVFVADLNRMPHLLIAGATGQGKSVGLNTVIASLLYKKHPAEVKFILIDPKKVEMSLYQPLLNHFLALLPEQGDEGIVTDVRDAVKILKSLCIEMDQRYDLLKRAHVRNLREYNQKFVNRKLNPRKGHKFLPYIVLMIDELADMMMVAGKEVELPIARLAQLARAVGIHLVVATQRPSVNVITGIIKANFPARLSYRVISKVDSRTILDANGADQLIGRGDMLLSTGSDLIRIQNAFVDTPEVERIVEYIARQRGFPKPYYLPELPEEDAEEPEDEEESFERDSKFEEAARLIVRYQIGSASLIQRKMKLGYNRAGRIIDQLEKAKIVGPYSGSKAREVLIQDESELERYLSKT